MLSPFSTNFILSLNYEVSSLRNIYLDMLLLEKDIRLLEQVFNVVLYAFGGDKFEKQLGTGSLSLLKRALGEVAETRQMTVEQAEEIAAYFATARVIIDPIEFHTLTGFTWEEGSELYERIKNLSLIRQPYYRTVKLGDLLNYAVCTAILKWGAVAHTN